MERKRYIFTSDVHLGAESGGGSEDEFIGFLSSLPPDTLALYLLGDIFDFWFEKKSRPMGHDRVLEALRNVTSRGMEVFFLGGNHDYWTFGELEKATGMKVIRKQPLEIVLGGRRFCIAHGDGLGRLGAGGWLLQRFLKGRLSIALTRWLVPARWLDAFAAVWSRSSRHSNSRTPYVFNENSTLYHFACDWEKQHQADFFIFGHVHRDIDMSTPGGARLLILSDWSDGPCWLEFDGRDMIRHSGAEGFEPKQDEAAMPASLETAPPETTGSPAADTKRPVGLSVSLASLRSTKCSGIGDLGDASLLIDLAKTLGMNRIELQSVVDTADGTISGTPIYPVFVDLAQAGHLMNHTKEAGYNASAAALDALTQIDYTAVYNTRLHFLFDMFRQEGPAVLGSEEYHAFWRANRPWLEQYAAYCTLRHKYGTGNSRYWSEPNYTNLLGDEHFIREYSEDLRFHCYVQFLAHKQLQEVSRLATENGIDLTISGPAQQAPICYTEPWVAEESIRKKLQESDSGLVLPLTEWLGVTSLAVIPHEDKSLKTEYDHKAGITGFRMAMTLEAILSHKALLGQIRKMIEESAE